MSDATLACTETTLHDAPALRIDAAGDTDRPRGVPQRRALLRLPDPLDWRPIAGAALARAFERLSAVDGPRLAARLACSQGAARSWPPSEPTVWRILGHPLSAHALQRSRRQGFQVDRAASEATVCADVVAPLRAALAQADVRDFVDIVERTGQAAGAGSGFRTRSATLRGDASGAWLRLPSRRHIAPLLAELHAYLRRYLSSDPLFVTAVAMVAITNLHPFVDANGRSSRILGNALLQIVSPHPPSYLPFYEIAWHAGHGWEIRVRLAELRADWEPLCGYLCDAIDLAATLAPEPEQEPSA